MIQIAQNMIFPHGFSTENALCKQTKPTVSQHVNSKGEPLSDYELFLKFKPGSKLKDYTYPGNKTLAWYRERKYTFTSELQALMMKLNNCHNRTSKAILYDNTGSLFRKIVLEIEDGVIITNLLTGEFDPEKRKV